MSDDLTTRLFDELDKLRRRVAHLETLETTPLSTLDGRYINATGDTMTGALVLSPANVTAEFIRLIGTSADDNTQSLVDAANLTTPGAIVGWYKVYVQDDKSSGAITDGVYWQPFYTTPTA